MLQTPIIAAALLVGLSAWSQQPPYPERAPTAEAIMTRAAANQDREEDARRHYIYVQHARVASRKGKTVMCEELTDIRISPTPKGSHQQLLKLEGRVLDKHKYVAYNTLLPDKDNPDPAPDAPDAVKVEAGELDRNLVEDMRNGLTHDKDAESKDGIAADLFPLTTKKQGEYAFHLIGRERLNDRDVFHVGFGPKDPKDYGWKGDAYIDTTAYEPVVVSTTMNRKLPFAVRTLMGTNLPGLGFTVVYAPQPDGVWFPTSFSTEFKIHVLFFFNREITIDTRNRDFQKTHVTAEILGADSESQ